MTHHFLKLSDPQPASPRRTFIRGVIAGGGLLAAGGRLSATESLLGETADIKPAFRGPNVVLIRFGGGARRKETSDPQSTYSPFLCRQGVNRGTSFNDIAIAQT